jgi:hypothetical protein
MFGLENLICPFVSQNWEYIFVDADSPDGACSHYWLLSLDFGDEHRQASNQIKSMWHLKYISWHIIKSILIQYH